jgi:hypothetical protein
MRRANVSPAGVEHWMESTADYAAHQRGIYLFYSHSYDLLHPHYTAAMAHFLDYAATLERKGTLHTTNMVEMADFMTRFIATTASFARSSDGVHVRLTNPHGLAHIAFAVPTAWIHRNELPADVDDRGTQGNATILSVNGNADNLELTLPGDPAP